MTTLAETLRQLKDADQDFEWYPTTDEMIDAVFWKCGDLGSMLDIGAGDGRVLERIDKLVHLRASKESGQHYNCCIHKYAIEKAPIHIERMPPDISIVGTDFVLQTLIDKKVDVVFCNPPYTEYEGWATKIIKEANAKFVFLILPDRWTGSKLIEEAIKQRGAVSRVVWSGDFSNADRQARARVDIIKITITTTDNDYQREETNPFNVWFDEYFAGFGKLKSVDDEDEDEETKKPDPMHEIVEGQNLIERLASLYTHDMNNLLDNYKGLSELDSILLKEIGVSVDEIKAALKLKIEGLKNKYWQELFDNLDKITSRLTSGSRSIMLERLNANCNVDFSTDNAYAVVLWAIKNANRYIDQQLIDMFKTLTEPECVKNYKSNQRTWERGEWRYGKYESPNTHYMLEYRIITNRHSAIKPNDAWSSWDFENNLSKNCHNFINDIMTIANNLGFTTQNRDLSDRGREWESNKEQIFRCTETGDKLGESVLMAVRAFKNGNLHLKFKQKFIKTLNIEASRLLGWIKTPQDAVDEMGLSKDFVKAHFKTNLLFVAADGQKLLTA